MMFPISLCCALAFAGPEKAEASVSASGSTRGDAIHVHAPENHMLELGVWGGILLPSARHEFYDPVNAAHSSFRVVAPDFGLRFAYLPLRFLGAEIEGGLMPTRSDPGDPALLYTVRGHAIGQLPWWRVAPFLVVGGGSMGVSSGRGALGKDLDASFHWGPGAKFFINRWLAVRLDLRHLVGAREGYKNGASSHFEVLAGLSVTFRLKKQEGRSRPGDRDGDGVADTTDRCPDDVGSKPDGCPRDTDGDGVADHADACVDEPETENGYEDLDGCPDTVPHELHGAVGRMPGITFEVNSARITPESKQTLDAAVEALENNPKYVVNVEGHTDSTGDREHNVELSQKRADAVAKYLVDQGVAEGRVSTKGYGPDKPLGDNETAEGRAENRRIEFKLRRARAKKAGRK